jgi:hypothetical protein
MAQVGGENRDPGVDVDAVTVSVDQGIHGERMSQIM